MGIEAVIFDLDGVIVSTDEYHYRAWQRIADEYGIYFDRQINMRLRGVSRGESAEILLERAEREYSDDEKGRLAEVKNGYYLGLLEGLGPNDILPGVMDLLGDLKGRNVKISIGSSSKNSPVILERIGLADFFDACADGNDIAASKPDPEVFLLAAEKLGVSPLGCVVVEDAAAGVEAAIAAGMKCIAVGSACGDERAEMYAKDLTFVSAEQIIDLFK